MKDKNTSQNKTPKRLSKISGKRWIKIVLRLLLYPALMLTVVVVAAFLFLQTQYAQDKLKSFIEDAAEKSFQAKLHIGKISGDLLSNLSADQVTLYGTKGLVLKADRISIRYLSPFLLKKIFLITDLRLEGLALNLIKAADGSWNVADLIPQEEKTNPLDVERPAFSLILKHITIADSRVVLTEKDKTGETIRRFDNIRLSAGIKTGPAITARIFDMAFDLDNPRFSLSKLSGKIAYDPKRHRFECDTLSIKTDASDLTLNATVALTGEYPEIDATALIKEMSLPELGQWIGVKQLSRGKLTGSIHAKGTPESISHELELHLGRLSVQSRGKVTLSEAGGLGLDISGTVQGMDPVKMPGYAPEWMTGDINAQIRAKGMNLNRPDRQGTLDITLHESKIAGHSITSGHFNLKARRNDLNIQNGRLTSPSGTMEMEAGLIGILDEAGLKKANVRARFTDLDLAGLTRQDEIQGRINLDLAAAASFPSPSTSGFEIKDVSAQVSAKIHASRILEITIHEGHLNALWADSKLVITRADLSAEPGDIHLNGSADFKNRVCHIKARAALPDLRQLILPASQWLPQISETVKLAGELNLSAEIRGWWHDPLISASVDGKEIQCNYVSAETCNIAGTWRGLPERFISSSQWRIQGLRVNEHLFPRVETRMDISPDRILIDGTGTYENEEILTLRGKIDSWLASEKNITIDSLKLSAKEGVLVNKSPIRAVLSRNTLEIKSLNIASDQAVLSLRGRIAKTGNQSLKLSLTNMDFDQVAWMFQGGKRINGIVSADMDISGTSENPVISATLSVRNGSLFDFSFSNLNLELQYARSEATVKASVYKADKKILDAKGKFSSSLSFMPFHFQPRFTGMDVSASVHELLLSTLPIPLQSGWLCDGILEGRAKLEGDLSAPDIAADLVFKDGTVKLGDNFQEAFEFSNLNIRFRQSSSNASFDASLYREENRIIRINGDTGMLVSLRPFSFKPLSGGLDVTLETSDLKLSVLPIPRIKGLFYDGILNLSARATGSVGAPEIDGNLALKAGRLDLTDPPLSYETLTAAIRFSNDRIIVDNMLIKGNTEGSLQGKGIITLSGALPNALDFRLTGENVYIPYKRAIRARVHPDLTLSGDLSAPKLTGNLTITESRVNLDHLSDQGPAEIQVINTRSDEAGHLDLGEEEIEGPAFMKPLSADVTVNIPNRAWLKGQGFNTEIGGQINLKKERGQPFTLVGSLNTIRGTYTFRGKRFKVDRGIVTFMGLAEPDPALDIEGVYAVKGIDIIARLTGTARQINLVLDSDPQMDQADIISYLFFGRPIDSLKGQQAVNAETAALNLTGQLSSLQLSGIIEDMFNIDAFSVDVYGEDIGSGAVSIGKYVHPNVFLNYRQGFKVDEIHQLSVIYEMNKNFSLEALIGDEKYTGVDLIWEHDF